jgi:hypothetical protein
VEVLAAIRRGDTRVIIATEDTALVDLLCRGLHRNVRDVEAPSFKCFLALGEEFVSLIASSQILWLRLELQKVSARKSSRFEGTSLQLHRPVLI